MPEVYLKLLRFLQLNHPLTEAIFLGFFLILSEARKITRYWLQQHKSCGKPSVRNPRQKKLSTQKNRLSYDDKNQKLFFISNCSSLKCSLFAPF